MEQTTNASTTATGAGNDVGTHARIRKLTFDSVNWVGEQFLIAAGLVLSIAAFLM